MHGVFGPNAFELTTVACAFFVFGGALWLRWKNPRQLLNFRLRLFAKLAVVTLRQMEYILIGIGIYLIATASMHPRSSFWIRYGDHIWTDVMSIGLVLGAAYASLSMLFRVDPVAMARVAGGIDASPRPGRQLTAYLANFACETPHTVSLHLRPAGLTGTFSRRLPSLVNNVPMVAGIVRSHVEPLRQAGVKAIRIASPHISQRTLCNSEKTAQRMARFFPGLEFRILPPRKRGFAITLVFRLLEARCVSHGEGHGTAPAKRRSLAAICRLQVKHAIRRPMVFRGFDLYL